MTIRLAATAPLLPTAPGRANDFLERMPTTVDMENRWTFTPPGHSKRSNDARICLMLGGQTLHHTFTLRTLFSMTNNLPATSHA